MTTICPNCKHQIDQKTRNSSQNNSLYLFFKWISDIHNELGWTLIETVAGIEIELIWTPELVKYRLWYPIQKVLYDIDSTTRLTTEMINTISDTIIKYLGDKGIRIEFPNIQTFLNSIDSKIK